MLPRKILLLEEESLKGQSLPHTELHSDYCPVSTSSAELLQSSYDMMRKAMETIEKSTLISLSQNQTLNHLLQYS